MGSGGRTDPYDPWYSPSGDNLDLTALLTVVPAPPVVRTSRAIAPRQAATGTYNGELCAHTATDCGHPAFTQPHGKQPGWVVMAALDDLFQGG